MVKGPGFVLVIFFDRKTFYMVFLIVPPDRKNRRILNDEKVCIVMCYTPRNVGFFKGS